jgi:hypothetical protein
MIVGRTMYVKRKLQEWEKYRLLSTPTFFFLALLLWLLCGLIHRGLGFQREHYLHLEQTIKGKNFFTQSSADCWLTDEESVEVRGC